MRQSLMCVIFAAALLLHSSCALPVGLAEDSSLEQDSFTSLLSDEVTEKNRDEANLITDDRTRGQRVVVVADPSLWRDLRMLHNGLPVYKRRADDNSQVVKRTNTGQDLSIPILRRDTMRCMVGRVYRPCWEV
ncbi:pro-melanin-concentrating hormone, like [Phyllopteryx taeniolatus]|uniref:pro-melanin-concentrating hormone, like n=1 Tax=Phyllopteryx taeniolatus TaxID=161469 RepID=UPI002AD42670|nr:pro-melanin-concentrating hormone, like [Phyllopteryx taeniolatus]